MANKVPWYVTIDWKNITGIIGVMAILGIVVFFLVLPNLVQNNKLSKYKGETTGTVTLVTENTEIDHGHEGTKIYIGSYTVNYHYQVNGQTYDGREQVKATPNAARILHKITSGESKQLLVRYDESRPAKSTILID